MVLEGTGRLGTTLLREASISCDRIKFYSVIDLQPPPATPADLGEVESCESEGSSSAAAWPAPMQWASSCAACEERGECFGLGSASARVTAY